MSANSVMRSAGLSINYCQFYSLSQTRHTKKQSINEITANLCTVLQIKRDTLNPGTLLIKESFCNTNPVRDAFNLSRDAINLPRGNVHRRCCKSRKKYGHFDAYLTLKITVWQRGAVSREWRARLLYIIVQNSMLY